MGKTEKHTGTCTEISAKGAITIYSFACPEGTIDATAFMPTKEGDLPLPQIYKGKSYSFGVEKRESNGKTYTNLAKKWANKKPVGYDIQPAQDWDGILPAPMEENFASPDKKKHEEVIIRINSDSVMMATGAAWFFLLGIEVGFGLCALIGVLQKMHYIS